jgi:GNAT superfamily N-acetyltransferase
MSEIVPLAHEHSCQVADLHLELLRTELGGEAGRRLLSLYYSGLADGRGGCGYVALCDSAVAGFVCGVWDRRSLHRHLIRRAGGRLLFWAGVEGLARPRVALSLVCRLFAAPGGGEDLGAGAYELRPVAVARGAQGSGLGLQLVQVLLADAWRRGRDAVVLLAEPDNVPAQRLYLKAGFEKENETARRGVRFLRFRRSRGPTE